MASEQTEKQKTFIRELSKDDVTIEPFEETKNHLLKAVGATENKNYPIKKIKFKITFYWEGE